MDFSELELASEYVPKSADWLIRDARLSVCDKAKDPKDAEKLLQMLGLISDTRASDSDSINDPVPPPTE